MAGERIGRLKELFVQCVDLDAEAQQAFLDAHCPDDPELRHNVERLLRNSGEGIRTVDPKLYSLLRDRILTREYAPGDQIGVYTIVRRLDDGGMSEVYLAERMGQTGQTALKILPWELRSDEFRKRFEQERDLMGLLRGTPNIAHLEYADITEDGVPYIAMEYVAGARIDKYCQQPDRTTKDVLNLMVAVARAVHSAHVKLIVHRDLKPSNILVTAGGTPKLLDFGIATVIEAARSERQAARSERSLSIVRDLHIMTLKYASPEQINGESPNVKMDVYSLGVILYMLLTGVHPQRVEGLPEAEAKNKILTVDAQLPSTAAEGSKDAIASPQALRGDLGNILLKAIHKDPGERYQSADQLADELVDYLEGRPVRARPDTQLYRMKKFVQRNKPGVIAAAAFLSLLTAGIIVAENERAVAQRRFSDVHSLATWLIYDFHDHIEKLNGATNARRELVQRAMQYLDQLSREAAGDSAIQKDLAKGYLKLGDVLGYPNDANLGDRKGAMESYHKAEAILDSLNRTATADTESRRYAAVVKQRVGELLLALGDQDGAFRLQQSAVAALKDAIDHGARTPENRRALAVGHIKLGELLEARGDSKEAMEQYRAAEVLFDEQLREKPNDIQAQRDVSVIKTKYGDVNCALGKLEDAMAAYRAALQIREPLFQANPDNREISRDLATTYDRIATTAADMGKVEEALAFEQKAVNLDDDVVHRDDKNVDSKRDLAGDHGSLGELLGRFGRWKEAAAQHQKSLTTRKDLYATIKDVDLLAELADSYLQVGLADAKLRLPQSAENLKMGRDLANQAHEAIKENIKFHEQVAKAYALSAEAAVAFGDAGKPCGGPQRGPVAIE